MLRGLTIATITSSGPGKYRGGQRGNAAGGWKRDQRSLVPLHLCDVSLWLKVEAAEDAERAGLAYAIGEAGGSAAFPVE